MIKYCLDKWNANKDKLEKALREDTTLNRSCGYGYLVRMVIEYILNGKDPDTGRYDALKWDAEKITEVDDGDYHGTLLYLIPSKLYQLGAGDYLMTFAYYGSCSGCDTLQNIQNLDYEDLPTDRQVSAYMNLCKDLVCNMIKPYNYGWRNKKEFETVEENLDPLKF